MTIYRFTAFFVMAVTLIVALAHPDPFEPKNRGPHDSTLSSLFDFSGFAGIPLHGAQIQRSSYDSGIFTTAAVALNFHYTLPDLMQPLGNKRRAAWVTSGALVVATFFYLLLGILAASYFREHTEPLSTLNWKDYTGLAVPLPFHVLLFSHTRGDGAVTLQTGLTSQLLCKCGS